MKYIVIGAVAAGTKTAAKLLRQDRSAEVCIYSKSKDISYAGCGLPYYVGGGIATREQLIVNTPEKYSGLTGAEVKTGMEAIKLNASEKTVLFRNVVIGAGADVEDCIIMNDSVVGENSLLKNVILDKDVVVRPGTKLIGAPNAPIIIKRGEIV